MFTAAISKTESGYQLKVFDDKTMQVIYKKERGTYEGAQQEKLNFLYRGPDNKVNRRSNTIGLASGGSGDGEDTGRRRRSGTYVSKNDTAM